MARHQQRRDVLQKVFNCEIKREELTAPIDDAATVNEESEAHSEAEMDSDSEACPAHGGAAEEEDDIDAPLFCEICGFLVRVTEPGVCPKCLSLSPGAFGAAIGNLRPAKFTELIPLIEKKKVFDEHTLRQKSDTAPVFMDEFADECQHGFRRYSVRLGRQNQDSLPGAHWTI